MALEETLDTGPVYRRAEVPISEDVTLDELRAQLVAVGTDLLVDGLANGLGTPEPQLGEATYAAKIDPEELRIDWRADAGSIRNIVRIGGAFTTVRGKRLKVLEARTRPELTDLEPGQLRGVIVGTGSGGLELGLVQPEAKPPRAADAWANGLRLGADERLGG